MAGSSFGTLFKLTTFGESHGTAIGGIIEGFPPNIKVDFSMVQAELDRRKPGQSTLVSQRKESDTVSFLSGFVGEISTGTAIGFTIPNDNQKSDDYANLDKSFRPSHADYTYEKKYGIRDHKGGGRSSARETACRVVAGALAKQALEKLNIRFSTYVIQVGPIQMATDQFYMGADIESNPVRCPDKGLAKEMESLIENTKKLGDTLGGTIQCIIENVPAGLGEPVFDKIHADLGKAMLSINAVKGFEIGSGFHASSMLGSTHNDLFNADGSTQTNHSGGVQGGISNGMPILFRVAFKPVSTILKKQALLTKDGEIEEVQITGRHDACVVPRAVPIVESMAAIVILDFYLRNKSVHL